MGEARHENGAVEGAYVLEGRGAEAALFLSSAFHWHCDVLPWDTAGVHARCEACAIVFVLGLRATLCRIY